MDKKLSIGILMNSTDLPLWEIHLIERLKNSNYASVDLVVLNDTSKKPISIFQKIKNNWSNILLIFFTKLERKIFRVEPNAHEIRSSNEFLRNIPVIKVNPISTKYSDRFPKKKNKKY